MKDTDLAYAAGLLDGEGCVNMSRLKSKCGNPYYHFKVTVANSDRVMIDWLASRFQGKTYTYANNHKYKNAKDSHWWQAYGTDALMFLEQVEPFLLIKKSRARLLMRLIRKFPPQIGKKRSESEHKILDACYLAFKKKNQRGKSKEL